MVGWVAFEGHRYTVGVIPRGCLLSVWLQLGFRPFHGPSLPGGPLKRRRWVWNIYL